MKSISREEFLSRLESFQEGTVIGHAGGVGLWFQLLTALFFEHQESGEQRLLLGEAFVHPERGEWAPRNACILPWDRVRRVRAGEAELRLDLTDGWLRILPPQTEPSADWLESAPES